MKRRTFIAGLGGAAVWPLMVRAQQPDRVRRRIGLLMNLGADDPNGRERVATFTRELQRLNWTDGHNVQIDIRWAAGEVEQFRKDAQDLVALKPEVILAVSTPAVVPLRQATLTIPIVFVAVVDPVGSGLVASLARPGGNATGFTLFEYSIGAKWLELLKEVAPHVARVAVLRDSTTAAGIGGFAAIQALAASTGIELSAIDLNVPSEIEHAVAMFAQGLRGGLIVTPSSFGANHPEFIAAIATMHGLPAVYPFYYFVRANGLISYGPSFDNQFRSAAGYVDRILKGEKPANLPVQAPTKYELAINLKIAKALDITIPPSLLARADEVIE
jgi:putative tryptophan/tyrosine transport system substrate-binding protein